MKLGNPSKEEEYILTLEEKKKTFIPKSVVSKSVYDKLTSLDIKTVGDVLARGHVEMEALTNTATVSKIDAFMRTMGLSLFPRIREWGAPKNLDIKRKDYARVKESREYTSENQGYPSD